MPMKIINAVGARPNFMKVSPIVKEMKKKSNELPYYRNYSENHVLSPN